MLRAYTYIDAYPEVRAMKISWQTKADRLLCRWSGVGERVHYDPPFIEDASIGARRENVPPSVPDFTRLSSFGGKEWYSVSPTVPRS
jgi:hypothetical protein